MVLLKWRATTRLKRTHRDLAAVTHPPGKDALVLAEHVLAYSHIRDYP